MLMGSELRLESEVGRGSTFWFEVQFPLVENAELAQELESSLEPVGSPIAG
jgi:hypothetical protein